MEILKDGELVLFGTVGEGVVWGEEGFTALDVISALAELGRSSDVTVRINSGGGFVSEGVAIFNALDAHRGNVKVVIEGIAASAASVIAMAGDEIVMRSGSVMMIHDPAGFTFGTSEDHQSTVRVLETLANSLAEIYAERTGRDVAEIREEMKAEVWMSAKDAVAKGFADRVEKGRAKAPTAFDYRQYANAPERMVALAESRAWVCADSEAGQPAVSTGQKETTSMTTENGTGAAAEGIENKTEEAKVVETAEQVTARIRAEERQRSADITAACVLAGKPEAAAEFVASDKTPSQVLTELHASRATAKDDEISNRNNPAASDQPASWDKAVSRVNARK